MSEPRPNSRNAFPAGVSAVTIPACWNSRHPQCTARQTSARRLVANRRLSFLNGCLNVTPAFCPNAW